MKKIIIAGLFIGFIISFLYAKNKSASSTDENTVKIISNVENDNITKIGPNKITINTTVAKTLEKIEENNSYNNIIYTGDSRFVGMENIANGELFIAKSSQGYNYFIENLESIKDSYTKNDLIVIGFGVNDLHNIDKYIEMANILSENYNIAYLSINPIDEVKASKRGYGLTNEDIDNFNEKLQENLDKNVLYIDSNSHLKEDGFDTTDGIHYTRDTYKKIYNYINEVIE